MTGCAGGGRTAPMPEKRARRRLFAWWLATGAVPYTMLERRVRHQCCIAGRSGPAPWCPRVCKRPRGKPRGARLAQACARIFLCARCRVQVVLCSRCDRGNRYCSVACSGASRRMGQREAARRYQRSPKGRTAHAARSRRWRDQQRALAPAACDDAGVTHHGSPAAEVDAPLPSCQAQASTTPVSATAPKFCRRCARTLLPWVRQGFLRRRRTAAGAHLAGWPPRPRGHSP